MPPPHPLPGQVSCRVASPGWSGGAASSRLTGSLLIFSRVRILIQSHLLHSHLLLIVSLCALVRRKGLKTERSISGCLRLLLPPFPSAPPSFLPPPHNAAQGFLIKLQAVPPSCRGSESCEVNMRRPAINSNEYHWPVLQSLGPVWLALNVIDSRVCPAPNFQITLLLYPQSTRAKMSLKQWAVIKRRDRLEVKDPAIPPPTMEVRGVRNSVVAGSGEKLSRLA